MTVIERIFVKLTLFVVKDSYTKLHENPTNGLVATVRRRQTGAWTDVSSVYVVHLLLYK